ncbi:MAG: SigE family polymerase sigma factor [Chloroflexota bacterium]|jgi:RNA polymerase sigma-70 factor (ECF subfamily)|nr:SigE family polymerase sigma factor [Chloroflexota bacterium]
MTVEGLRRRRPETLGDLLETYGRELQGVAYLILRDRPAAEDVVIETLLTAFERGGSIRDERALRAWLLRVATNHALAAKRRSVRVVRLDLVPDGVASGDLGADSSTRLALLDGIAGLPIQMRAAVVLRYYADQSVDEVAATLGKSPNTIKAQLQTALDRLRVHLADPVGASLGEAFHA